MSNCNTKNLTNKDPFRLKFSWVFLISFFFALCIFETIANPTEGTSNEAPRSSFDIRNETFQNNRDGKRIKRGVGLGTSTRTLGTYAGAELGKRLTSASGAYVIERKELLNLTRGKNEDNYAVKAAKWVYKAIDPCARSREGVCSPEFKKNQENRRRIQDG